MRRVHILVGRRGPTLGSSGRLRFIAIWLEFRPAKNRRRGDRDKSCETLQLLPAPRVFRTKQETYDGNAAQLNLG